VTVPDELQLRPIGSSEFEAFYDLMSLAFHERMTAEDRQAEALVAEPARTLAFFDGDTIAGAAAIFTRDLTVPGGPIPVACVTGVAVAPTHTRRGLLTRLMRAQLTELHDERSEPVAALWASESAIYGRFGYGVASRTARINLSNRDVRLAVPVKPEDRRVRFADVTSAPVRAELATVYDRVRTGLVGHLDRRENWWTHRLHDPEHNRGGNTPFRVVLHDATAGPDGYVLFAVRNSWGDQGPQGEVVVQELVAETPAALTALWAFLLSVDLTSQVSVNVGPLDVPLLQLVDHPRRIIVGTNDNLWVRVVDVGRALAARRYACPVEVVFEVTDDFCPWNAGRWRLTGGPDGAACARTDDPADLALTSTELGAAYLGGTSLATLAAAGLVTEATPGALRAASVAFAEPRPPYCPEVF
jgi:predicted acetyltransferase